MRSICVLLLVILLGGCSSMQEGTRGFLGVSTKVLEDGRQDAIKQTFRYDYDSCYNEALKILKKTEVDTYIYAQDRKKGLIAVYLSETDTTPVGIFFLAINANNTQIEVASPATYAKESIANKLFSRLIIALNPGQEKAAEKKGEVK